MSDLTVDEVWSSVLTRTRVVTYFEVMRDEELIIIVLRVVLTYTYTILFISSF